MKKIDEKVVAMKYRLFTESHNGGYYKKIDHSKESFKDFMKKKEDKDYKSYSDVKEKLSSALKKFQQNPELINVNVNIEDLSKLQQLMNTYHRLIDSINKFVTDGKKCDKVEELESLRDDILYKMDDVSDEIDYVFAAKFPTSMYRLVGFLISFGKEFFDDFSNGGLVMKEFDILKEKVKDFDEVLSDFYSDSENKKDPEKRREYTIYVRQTEFIITIVNKFYTLSTKYYGKMYGLITSHTENIKNKSEEE